LIPANEFIPVAESTGLIVPIGDFVIETACRQLAQWQQQGYDTLSLAVNISAVQFWRGDLYETISRAIEETGISARRLELEITETAMMEYPDLVSEKIFALKRLGVRIALDDFGTGYSSLSYLRRFDIDILKIDRSFVHNMETDPNDLALCDSIIVMAHRLGLQVVAEGVETTEQQQLLLRAGCDYLQGYLFSKPLPAQDFEFLLKEQSESNASKQAV
jgi:EAL domain-containing protein (putative c-di-GMP-specific phosphodiesterase class I)